MFNSSPKPVPDFIRPSSPKNNTTVIANGVRVEGEFKSQSDVVIEGEVHGSFTTTSLLTVSPEARIKADVNAGEAIISGTVEGNLTIARRLDVKATAKVTGDIVAETISIDAGAIISGHLQIGSKASVADKTKPTDPPKAHS